MTRFRALLAGGVFALAFTIAGCFGDPGDNCTEFTSIGTEAAFAGEHCNSLN